MNTNRVRPFVLALVSLLVAAGAGAKEKDEKSDLGITAGVTGKYVYRDESKSKFLEDHNVQSGVDATLGVERTLGDAHFGLHGFGQSGERQGYVIGEYDQLGILGIVLDLEHWTEYYNDRSGGPTPTLFPFSSDSQRFFGNGIASTDWLTAGGSFDVWFARFVNILGDFHYRQVEGEQTLLKGGGLDGIFDASGTVFVPPPNADTGPVTFGFPGRKDLEYDAYKGHAGLRGDLWIANLEVRQRFEYHDIDSRTREISYDTLQSGGSLAAADTFGQDTRLKIYKSDVSASRHFSDKFYLFGAGFTSYERSDPEPDQFVFESITGRSLRTRETTRSKVERWIGGANLGFIFRPVPKMILRADTRVRQSRQEAQLNESRDETQLLTMTAGDVSLVAHNANRSSLTETTTASLDWRPVPRLTVRATARYQFRQDDIDTRQSTTLVGDRPEVEEYQQELHRITVGPVLRYRFRRGWRVEGGYQFMYTNVEQDVDQLINQYNLGDYELLRHRVFAKASVQRKKVRGELRGHFLYESRELDGAIAADALGNVLIPASGADVDVWSWQVAPAVYWMPHQQWTLHGRYAFGRNIIEADTGRAFEYDVYTQSLSVGATFSPLDVWSLSGDYTVYVNDQDVENHGHNASLSTDFKVLDNLSVGGGIRYLGYVADNAPDDYDAVVVSLGVKGTF